MSASKVIALATILSLLNSVYSAPSQACSLPNRSPIDWRPKANETRVFQIGTDPENPREIRVSVPPLYNEGEVNLPLILAFHDKEQSPAQLEYDTRFSDREINENKILVYPKAINVCIYSSFCCKITNAGSVRTHGNQILQFEGGRKIATRALNLSPMM
jgi:poly(3-hydroxybutyrate) depolymerase